MEEKKTNTEHGDICPHWNLENQKGCGVTKGGMYIPMPEHVRMFCLSATHHKCRNYVISCDLMNAQDEPNGNEFLDARDRRRLRRYPEQLYFDLVVCDRNIVPQIMNSYKAKSLDVSLGGLRLETFKKFAKDAVVSFVMDPEFSSDRVLGVGEVKWCEPKKDSNKFESGIAFSNYSTSESMREYLEL